MLTLHRSFVHHMQSFAPISSELCRRWDCQSTVNRPRGIQCWRWVSFWGSCDQRRKAFCVHSYRYHQIDAGIAALRHIGGRIDWLSISCFAKFLLTMEFKVSFGRNHQQHLPTNNTAYSQSPIFLFGDLLGRLNISEFSTATEELGQSCTQQAGCRVDCTRWQISSSNLRSILMLFGRTSFFE